MAGSRSTLGISRARLALAPVLVLAVGAIVGCGGNTTTVTRSTAAVPATAAPTKAQFIARADAICARNNAKLKPIQGSLKAIWSRGPSAIESEGATAFRRGAAITHEGIAQLQALSVPTGDAATVQKIITALNDEAADIDNAAAATAGGEWEALRSILRAERTTRATYDGLAQGYGLKVCGAGS